MLNYDAPPTSETYLNHRSRVIIEIRTAAKGVRNHADSGDDEGCMQTSVFYYPSLPRQGPFDSSRGSLPPYSPRYPKYTFHPLALPPVQHPQDA